MQVVDAAERNLRDFIHRDNYSRQEFVSDRLHVLDGGFQSCPHLLVGHSLLRSHIIRQLTVGDRKGEEKKRLSVLDSDDEFNNPMQIISRKENKRRYVDFLEVTVLS